MSKDVIVTGRHNLPQAPQVLKMIFLMIPLVLPLGFALDLYLPSIPSMATALDSTRLQIQMTLTLFMYCFGFGQIIVGPITDKFGRLPVLKASWLCFIVGSMLCTFSPTLFALLIGRALQAFGACGTQVVAFALVRDQYEGKNATLIYTSLKGAMAIAPIGAPILGAFLQVNYGWQANFAVLTLYGLCAAFASFTLKETKPDIFRNPQSGLSSYIAPYLSILSHREFLYFGLCGLATQAAMFGYFSLSPQYFVKLHGLTEHEFAHLFSINAFIFLLTSLIGGKFIYKIGFKKGTLLGGALLFFSGSFMILGDNYFNHPYVLFIPNLIASSAASIMLGAAASGAMMPFKNTAGSAAALFGCFEFIGGASVGQMAIWGDNITIIPLATILIFLSLLIGFSNFLLTQSR